MTAWARITDCRVSKWVVPSDIFHGLMGASSLSLQRAKQLGAVTLVDTPTLHPIAFRREVIADYTGAGVRPDGVDPVMPLSMVRRCEQQFQMCDRILVYSAAAQRSFEPFPYAAKTTVVHPGVDQRLFTPPPVTRRGDTFRVCFVGRIEAPKGIHHLIAAWKRLRLPDAELALAGKLLPEMTPLESDASSAHIRLAGILPPAGVAEFLREADLFVFPSVNEGLSLALLEAMSSGLPVIACRGTGADDCVTSGREGLLVPGRHTEALADAIQWCYRHRDELPAMGAAARTRIEAEFTLDRYLERLISLYRSLTDCG